MGVKTEVPLGITIGGVVYDVSIDCSPVGVARCHSWPVPAVTTSSITFRVNTCKFSSTTSRKLSASAPLKGISPVS